MFARLFSVALFASCATAQAADGVYLGANLGFANVDCESCDVDPNLGAKVYGGYKFNRYVGLEAGYAYLSSNRTGYLYDLSQESPYLAVALNYPLHDTIDLSLKGGGAYSRVTYDADLISGEKVHGKTDWESSFYWGLGLHLHVDEHATVRIEYERFSNESDNLSDADMVSVGFQHRF